MMDRFLARLRRVGGWLGRGATRADAALIPDAKRAHRTLMIFFTAVYLLTLHPGPGGIINLGDSAKFQFLPRIGGIGHPPGNPLYLMLTYAAVRVPVPLEDYVKVNLVSAICGLLTLSFVFRTMVQVTALRASSALWPIGSVRTAVLGTIFLGLGPTFWLLSTEAEVYTLSSLCGAIAVYGVVRWLQVRDRLAFGIGLFAWLVGFGNHPAIVSLAPALLWVLFQTRRDLRRPWSLLAFMFVGAAIGAGSYAYIWFRAKEALPYSEFAGPLDKQHFIDFVTAKTYQEALGKFQFVEGIRHRLPIIPEELQKQWLWPLLLLIPFGISRFFRANRTVFGFFALMTLGQLAIPFFYAIPDPEGYFMPTFPFLALMIAGGVNTLWESAWRGVLLTGTAATFITLGAIRFSWFWIPLYSADLNMGAHEGAVDFVFPTLFESIPEGADIVTPCGHYGGVELAIYYKMADSVVKRKHIGMVRFHWSEWDNRLLDVPVAYGDYVNTHVVCTVLKEDVAKLRDGGVLLQRVERAPYTRNFQHVQAAPIYCTGMRKTND
jgi:hypothetical protein